MTTTRSHGLGAPARSQTELDPETLRLLRRRAEQALRTDLLLGVDFLPRPRGGALPTGQAATAPAMTDPQPAPSEPASPTAVSVPAPAAARAPAPVTHRAAATGAGSASAAGSVSSSVSGSGSDRLDEAREERARRLAQLREEHDAQCTHCTTATAHTRTVFGEGDPAAELMFVGEAPGALEDQTGRPFVGRAGQKLDEIIAAMGLRREEVFIANVLKSRPPDNRTPMAHEVEACGPYLRRQIAVIRPRVIVALGAPAAKYLLGVTHGITRLRGVWWEYRDGPPGEELVIPVMPTFHPAYLLRNYTRESRQQVWSDMQQVCQKLRGS